MAHPYSGHHEEKVGRRRASKLTTGSEYKRGGPMQHDDAAADRALIHKVLREREHRIEGKKSSNRFARGGRTKKHGDVNVAVVLPHHPTPQPVMPAAALGAGAPPPVPGAPPGAGGPPGMPPGMPPPGGMGMPPGLRARGGRAFAKGGRVKQDAKGDFIPGESSPENIRRWQAYASRNSFAQGGHVYPKFTGGAQSGVGRLEEAHDQKRRHK